MTTNKATEEAVLRNNVRMAVVKYFNATHGRKPDFVPGESKVNYSGRVFDEKELTILTDAALDFWLTSGRFSDQFEKGFAEFLGLKYCLLTNSGSSANLLAMSALTSPKLGDRRLKPGDEVITVAAAFPTTVNPIVQNRLVPVFVDINLETYNIKTNEIEAAISDKTKAIFIAHTLGNPFDVKMIAHIAKKHNIWFLEDNCDAVGSKFNGQYTGTFGDISTYSFFPAHHLCMGEGGAVCTNDDQLKRIIESFRDWGRECFTAGTLVSTFDGVKPIECISIGDEVLTHVGEYSPVINCFNKKYTGSLYSIKSHLIPTIEVTNNHRFFVLRDEQPVWVRADELLKNDVLLEAIPCPEYHKKPFVWEYDTAYKKVRASLIPHTDLMLLIGYWLAEGSVSFGLKGQSGYPLGNKYYFYRVEFAFHKDETIYVNDVRNLMLKYFGVRGTTKIDSRNGISLTFKTRKGYEFFKQFFKTGSENKNLWDNMEFWDLDLLNSLVKGFWRGDGGNDFQSYNLSSVSLNLIEKLRLILLRNHILPCYVVRNKNKHTPSIVNGIKIISKHDLYTLCCYGINAEKLSKVVGENYSTRTTHQRAFIKNIGGVEYLCHPINKISYKSVDDIIVYNLEVDIFHSYHAGKVAVHNCHCPIGHDNSCGKRFESKFGQLPAGYDHKYVYSHIGYNLKATDMQAAVGVAQLEKLPSFIKARKRNFNILYEGLQEFYKYFYFPHTLPGSDPSWFGFPLTVRASAPFTRNDIVQYLEKNKIATRMLFSGNITRHPSFEDVEYRISGNLNNTDFVMENMFWIGVYPGLTDEMLKYIISVFRRFILE